MTTTTTNHLFHDAHVAGGWTEHDSVARRICTALWHATDAFKRITSYEADIVLDYMTIVDVVSKLEPGESFQFVYSVGKLGTHLAIYAPGKSYSHTVSFCDEIRKDDRGGNSAHFEGTVARSDWQTGEYGQRWGADKYALTIDEAAS